MIRRSVRVLVLVVVGLPLYVGQAVLDGVNDARIYLLDRGLW